MRKEGWKFVAMYKGFPTKYEFEKCIPEEYVYQLDYVIKEEDTADYHQLFKDAKWEEVYSWDGTNGKWYYFCKKVENGKKERIYTDTQSKLQLVNKLLLSYGSFFLLIISLCLYSLISLTNEGIFGLWIDVPLSIIYIFGVIWMGYCIWGMLALRNRLKSDMD